VSNNPAILASDGRCHLTAVLASHDIAGCEDVRDIRSQVLVYQDLALIAEGHA
jgi:hypothetical protein